MCYIGKTVETLKERKRCHLRKAKKSTGHITFQDAIRINGIENFKWEIIYECDEVMLDMMETFKIMVNHSHYSDGGYNLTWGGGSRPIGYKLSEEHKQRLREINTGKKHSLATKQKIRDFNKGKILSDTTKQKLSVYRTGTHLSNETKSKISKSLKAKKRGIVNPS
jgi:group I intron endonuclease